MQTHGHSINFAIKILITETSFLSCGNLINYFVFLIDKYMDIEPGILGYGITTG